MTLQETQSESIALSVVIPVLNEAANLQELRTALLHALDDLCEREGLPRDATEVIFVDDGSTDETWSMIRDGHAKDRRIGGIRLSRRFGHHLALTAGLDRARGEAVVLMDGDLQDPPEEIPRLYAKLQQGFDLVYGLRQDRQDPRLKQLNSRLFWHVINRLSGLAMPENQMMLRILSRRLVNALGQMRESARFLHGMMAWTGFEVTSLEIPHRARRAGRTKYSLMRQARLALYAVTSFSAVPLRMASVLGLLTSFASLAFGAWLVLGKLLLGFSVEGWASIITSMFFLAGVQLFVLGILGEYLGRIYKEVQRRPLYLVTESL